MTDYEPAANATIGWYGNWNGTRHQNRIQTNKYCYIFFFLVFFNKDIQTPEITIGDELEWTLARLQIYYIILYYIILYYIILYYIILYTIILYYIILYYRWTLQGFQAVWDYKLIYIYIYIYESNTYEAYITYIHTKLILHTHIRSLYYIHTYEANYTYIRSLYYKRILIPTLIVILLDTNTNTTDRPVVVLAEAPA